ncbi:hypothetical protein V500_10178 [Pseudogymnoascus sp. VKM F-4518 (FW-2643)]|nr:hypothetical protein V500_10178 [Pseudogymnoascus sp. VKM F-4518 (FW-2643)]
MQDPPARHEIALVGVVLYIRYRARSWVLGSRSRRDAWVIEVVRRAPEGVDLEFPQLLLAELLEQPVDYQTALDAALGVQDQHYFVDGAEHGDAQDLVADAHVGGAVVEGALDEALDDVEEDAGGAVVGAADGALEGEREAVDVGLHPVAADGDAVDEDPFFVGVGAELFEDRGVGFEGALGAVEEVAEELVEEDKGEDVDGDHPDGEEEPEGGGEDEDALGCEEDHVVEDGEDVAGGGEELVVEPGRPWAPGGDDGEDGGEEVDEGDEVGAEELPGRGGVGQWRAWLGEGDEGREILICNGAGRHLGVVDAGTVGVCSSRVFVCGMK